MHRISETPRNNPVSRNSKEGKIIKISKRITPQARKRADQMKKSTKIGPKVVGIIMPTNMTDTIGMINSSCKVKVLLEKAMADTIDRKSGSMLGMTMTTNMIVMSEIKISIIGIVNTASRIKSRTILIEMTRIATKGTRVTSIINRKIDAWVN